MLVLVHCTFEANTVTSYFKDANLASLSLRWEFFKSVSSQISWFWWSLRFRKDFRYLSRVLVLSQTWQVSTLDFLKLRTSFNSVLKIFLNVEKLITGPLFFLFNFVVLTSGCLRIYSDHIFRIDSCASKYFLLPLRDLL